MVRVSPKSRLSASKNESEISLFWWKCQLRAPTSTHPVLSNSNAGTELSRASLRAASTYGEDTWSYGCGVVSVSLSSKEILLKEELGYKRAMGSAKRPARDEF